MQVGEKMPASNQHGTVPRKILTKINQINYLILFYLPIKS